MNVQRPSQASHLTAEIIEDEKENIVPLQGGRSVSKLAKTLAGSRSQSIDHLKLKLQQERDQHEKQLKDSDELHDPLQVYLNYINWTHHNFPQGANASSGLFNLLERCASNFRDIPLYKNDPRYLKVWLEYIEHHDTPRDAFIYLATKKIGVGLALFYEEFARHLESKGKVADAFGVYEIGIQYRAYPMIRLEKSFQRFKDRVSAKHITVSHPSEDIRRALALKKGDQIEAANEEQPLKRSKIDVFQDNAESDLGSIKSAFEKESSGDSRVLESRSDRIKENTLASSRWSGQILQQKKMGNAGPSEKLHVFCDNPPNPSGIHGDDEPSYRTIQSDQDSSHVYTHIEHCGKRPEKLMLNLDLLYSEVGSESSPVEILAKSRQSTKVETSSSLQYSQKPSVKDHSKDTVGLNVTSIDDTSRLPTKDPTVTMFSKMAKDEVFGIFNQASQTCEKLELDDTRLEDPTFTNLDGFVTETLPTVKTNSAQLQEPLIPTQVDGINSNLQNGDCASSSFQFHPPLGEEASSPHRVTIDPFDHELRHSILRNLVIPLVSYPGYFESSNPTATQFHRVLDAVTNSSAQYNPHSLILDCFGKEMYSLVSCFIKNECSLVCLVESESGCLKVLKIMRPASSWEFFILRRIRRRMLKDLAHEKQFVKAESLFNFGEESFLVLEYYPQGNLMNVIDLFKVKGKQLAECLVMFFSIRLLEAVETLHGMDIVHGSISPKNCMVNFVSCEDRNLSACFDRDGKYGWDRKRLTLIDFSASIDLTEFHQGTYFSSCNSCLDSGFVNWTNGRGWTFEVDYFGLAKTIHALLFGESLGITRCDDKVQIRQSLSRFWQPRIWQEVFEVLLNPEGKLGSHDSVRQLRKIRGKLEAWLESYAEAGDLRGIILSLEEELGSQGN
ncbi:BUB1 [Candida theae]|uniref:BUB1 n=1 Tax=Candida theae TaxID=1198502 RepID=A0AAD5BID4_9ASCO|nr:BUB1 [Candida theae]KAI5965988.1 BUB1 [Candida theae]